MRKKKKREGENHSGNTPGFVTGLQPGRGRRGGLLRVRHLKERGEVYGGEKQEGGREHSLILLGSYSTETVNLEATGGGEQGEHRLEGS